MRRRFGNLRAMLLASMLLTTLAALVVALGSMIAYDLRSLHQSWVADVSAQAELLARTTASALAFDDERVARDNLEVLRFQPKVRAAAIYDARGQRFASFTAEGVPAAEFPPLPGADGVTIAQGEMTAWKRIIDHGQILGTIYLRADYGLYGYLWGYAGIALGVAAFAMLVALAVSAWLRRIVLRPIQAVGAAAREVVATRDYTRRVERRSDDELGALADAFNEMMAEVERRNAELEASNREKARQVDERAAAQQEVMRLNEELERRVRERTAQLERSNSELALASAAAEDANRAKSQFLSNMSHELRTPLNAIIGFGTILADDKLPPERRKAFLKHVVDAGRHLLTLINDVLNLAQVEAGKVTVSMEPVALAEVLEQCRVLTEPQAAQRGIRLVFPIAPEGRVLADHTRLKQVLLNLLSNAIKYNRQAGSVIVECSAPASGKLRVAVRDTGIGMRGEQVQALFQPFNRLGQEGGTREGTGIGLVVTRHLMELMGGEIGVDSTAGSGSTFWIDLRSAPAATLAEDPPADDPAPRPAAAGVATVLCVEDNPVSLELIRAALAERPGVRLLAADNGLAGVEMARHHRPDVILMDNNMPLMSGSEAQAILKRDPRTSAIPIIAISANAMPAAISGGLEAGFFRYLTKPVEFDALNEALDSALAAVRAPPPTR
jgi:signal transduction histidine kinase/CheY-like chemotaxis protein